MILPKLLCYGLIYISAIYTEKDNRAISRWIQTAEPAQKITQKTFILFHYFMNKIICPKNIENYLSSFQLILLELFCEFTEQTTLKWSRFVRIIKSAIKILLDCKLLEGTNCIVFMFEFLWCFEGSRHPLNSCWIYLNSDDYLNHFWAS